METKALTYVLFKYSFILLVVFGILGNFLVVISILKQRRLLKNNYYYLVLHLAICDLSGLVLTFGDVLKSDSADFYDTPVTYCLFMRIDWIFGIAGLYMMLFISVHRYRSTVHPLHFSMSRRRLKITCGFGYIIALIVGYGGVTPSCFMPSDDVRTAYLKYFFGVSVLCFFVFPTTFMAVAYYKVSRVLVKQNKYMKQVCSNAARSRYTQNRRNFVVCFCTVLCYGVGTFPIAVCLTWYIVTEQYPPKNYDWIRYFSLLMQLGGSNASNPLIYGLFDKKLLKFWKLFNERKSITQEN